MKGNKNNSAAYFQFTIRIPSELLKQIEAFARKERRTRTNAIELLLWRVVKEN
jgi:predicted transcriptional regulator